MSTSTRERIQMTTDKFSGRNLAMVAAFSLALLPAGACSTSSLLDAPIVTVIDPSAVNSAAGADALRIGEVARLRGMTAGSGSGDSPWMFAGLLTDEWKSSDTVDQRNETNKRA